jgi:hypothetical protein
MLPLNAGLCRFLSGGRRQSGGKESGSESARCAGRVATRQGRTSIDAGQNAENLRKFGSGAQLR